MPIKVLVASEVPPIQNDDIYLKRHFVFESLCAMSLEAKIISHVPCERSRHHLQNYLRMVPQHCTLENTTARTGSWVKHSKAYACCTSAHVHGGVVWPNSHICADYDVDVLRSSWDHPIWVVSVDYRNCVPNSRCSIYTMFLLALYVTHMISKIPIQHSTVRKDPSFYSKNMQLLILDFQTPD